MVLMKVVIVRKVGRDGFSKFVIVLCQLANMLNSLFRQALSLIWGHVYAPKTGMCVCTEKACENTVALLSIRLIWNAKQFNSIRAFSEDLKDLLAPLRSRGRSLLNIVIATAEVRAGRRGPPGSW